MLYSAGECTGPPRSRCCGPEEVELSKIKRGTWFVACVTPTFQRDVAHWTPWAILATVPLAGPGFLRARNAQSPGRHAFEKERLGRLAPCAPLRGAHRDNGNGAGPNTQKGARKSLFLKLFNAQVVFVVWGQNRLETCGRTGGSPGKQGDRHRWRRTPPNFVSGARPPTSPILRSSPSKDAPETTVGGVGCTRWVRPVNKPDVWTSVQNASLLYRCLQKRTGLTFCRGFYCFLDFDLTRVGGSRLAQYTAGCPHNDSVHSLAWSPNSFLARMLRHSRSSSRMTIGSSMLYSR